ncbi:MAG: FGGY family carbohydrate kinase [Candidatus Sumerlaeia bacterium]|nr:FGGY family carbohydrate kinase [Candidatus Sumerlaeia bacterium]
MSLMGIDVGTTGCKVIAFNEQGASIAMAYAEYDAVRPQPGRAELDSRGVWKKICNCMHHVARQTAHDPVTALAVTCLGEAATPVSKNREILGNSILNFDERGQEEAVEIEKAVGREKLFQRNGNILGHFYTAPKLMWLKKHEPQLYKSADKFLLWEDFLSFMLGCDPVIDYSVANRTLLFDLEAKKWSDELASAMGLDLDKMAELRPSTEVLGEVAPSLCDEIGLPRGVKVVTGGHDQCCNALGAGVIRTGMAIYGMGTFICITPVYDRLPDRPKMLASGLNIEHHVVANHYVSFLYNLTGGALLKWFRDQFGQLEKREANLQGIDPYDLLLSDLPADPTPLLVLPHFAVTGPPLFESRTKGVIMGLTLETDRRTVLKGLLEGVTYYFREGLELLEQAGVKVAEFRATGGGAKSPVWLQIKADILGTPLATVKVTEAGALGAAMLAGIGTGVWRSPKEAVEAAVKVDRVFEPDARRHARYTEQFEKFRKVYPALKDLLASL